MNQRDQYTALGTPDCTTEESIWFDFRHRQRSGADKFAAIIDNTLPVRPVGNTLLYRGRVREG